MIDYVFAVVLYAAAIIFGWFAAAFISTLPAMHAPLPWWSIKPLMLAGCAGAAWVVVRAMK